MDLNPWKFWAPDGTPADGTLELVAVLERVLARQPTHIGANHYYIHAVEASPHPDKALSSAKRLDDAGTVRRHLVHMPAHTYIRTGQYLKRRAPMSSPLAPMNVWSKQAWNRSTSSATTGTTCTF